FQEGHSDFSDRTVALFGNNDLGLTLQFGIVLLVDFFAEDEHYQVGILLDRSRLAQVSKLWAMISAAALRSAAQLRECDYRHGQFLGQRLQPARDRRNFLGSILETLAAARHQL